MEIRHVLRAKFCSRMHQMSVCEAVMFFSSYCLEEIEVGLKGYFRDLDQLSFQFCWGLWMVESEMSSLQMLVYIMVGQNHGI